MEVSTFLTELVVFNYHFAPLKSSSVGLAALMTAMEGVHNVRLSDADKQTFAQNAYHVAQVSPNDPEVMDCRRRLRKMLYYEGGISQQQQEATAAAASVAEQERAAAPMPANVPAQAPARVPAQASVQAKAQAQAQAASGQQPSAGRTARGAKTGGQEDSASFRSNSPTGVEMTGSVDGSYSSGGNVASKNLNKDLETTAKTIRKSGCKGSKSSRAKKRQRSKAARPGPKTRAAATRAGRKNRRSGSS